MKFKKSLLIICIVVCLFSIASVSANEIDDAAITMEDNEIIAVDDGNSIENLEESLAESSNENLIGDSSEDDGTFSALQKKIDDAEERAVITLEKDYAYD